MTDKLTETQQEIVAVLKKRKSPITIRDLAEKVGLPPGPTARSVGALENLCVVTRDSAGGVTLR